jgi:hypothetical protein
LRSGCSGPLSGERFDRCPELPFRHRVMASPGVGDAV